MLSSKKSLVDTLAYVLVLIYCFVVIFPIFWVVTSSFKNKIQMREIRYLINFKPTLESYRDLFRLKKFGRLFLNSLIITNVATGITIPIAFMAAYGLSRFRFQGRQALAVGILGTRMLPSVALIIPIYALFRRFHLINSLHGLIIAHISFSLPFSIWILRGFLMNLSNEYEEAAMIDGCSRVGALFRIVLPISAPGLMSASLFCFLTSWSDFLFALILTVDSSAQTAPVGVSGLISAYGIEWGQLLAGSTLLIVPMVPGLTLGR
jgi:multiple sugar transport system permease protein